MTEPYLPNPESRWHAERPGPNVDQDEITRRIGQAPETITPLSGGLANDTFGLGDDRVLRIYRRDPKTLLREREILSREWTAFRVPQILDFGDDWLLLEFVAHRPLKNSRAEGEAVGLALAEIHQTRFDRYGLFGDRLQVTEPWDDFPNAIEDYIVSKREDNARAEFDLLLDRCAEWIGKKKGFLRENCRHPVLLHGDFKVSNVFWANDLRPLVLDWEFTYSGPALMDVGQLMRWGVPEPFRKGFFDGYTKLGCGIGDRWEEIANCFDLVNMVGLLTKSAEGSRQSTDCMAAIETLLG